MSTTLIKSAKVRNAVKAALGTAVAVPLLFAAMPASAVQVGDTTFDFSGYVKFDAVYNVDGTADGADGNMASDAEAIIGQDNDGVLETTVNQTRFRLSTNTKTDFGDVHGYVEMDFYNAGVDGRSLRRRLAYIQWNGWTIGRAWSSFSDFHYGTTLNFGGPEGQVGQRADLVRYTIKLGESSAFDVSLENGTNATLMDIGDDATVHQIPNLALRYSGAVGNFDYQVAGLVRYNDFDWGTGSDSKIGWGLNAGGAFALGTGTTLQLSTVYGEGIDDAGYGFTLLPATNYLDANGNVKNNTLWGVTASVGQQITNKLSTNLLYSYTDIEAGPNDADYEGRSLAVNLLYSPVKPLVFGVEYSRVYADIDGVGDADANIVQFSTIYNF